MYGQQNPNYFAKATLQFKTDVDPGTPGNQPGKWIERTLTSNGALNGNYGGNFPNSGALTPPTNDLWIRASSDGTNVITEYSYDGETFTQQAPPVPVTAYGANGVTKIGLFVKHDGSGPATQVAFDSFTVDAASCEEDEDTTPPRTTHALDPATPDGDGGWYVSPVEVTLNATDNEGGSGVDTTEYRFAGDEEWTAVHGADHRRRRGPPHDRVPLDRRGGQHREHAGGRPSGSTRRRRRRPRCSTARRRPPTTTVPWRSTSTPTTATGRASAPPRSASTAASGSRTWRRRRSSTRRPISRSGSRPGPAGSTGSTEEGGFARTIGGLGMPWYPKEYGDFSLKLQWRDSSTGTNGNSGVFARFPHPDETVARPAGGALPVPGRLGDEPAGVGGDLLRPRDPDQRPPGRRPEDRLDLQLLAEQRDAGADPAEGHVGRLRAPGRRPAVHDHPQRERHQVVPERARPAVVAAG